MRPIQIVKEAGNHEAVAVGGTEPREERPVALWESNTQRRLGFRDGRFGGTARNPVRFKKLLKRMHGRHRKKPCPQTFNVPKERLWHGHGAISWQPKRPY